MSLKDYAYRRKIIIDNTGNANTHTHLVCPIDPGLLPSGLVGSYHFNDVSPQYEQDRSGFNNHASLASGATNKRASKVGNGLNLTSNTSDYLLVPTFKYFPTTAITVAFWLKTTDNNCGVFSYASSANANNFLVFINSSNMIDLYVGSTSAGSVCPAANDGNWHYWVITWQSSNGAYAIRVDGVQKATGTVSSGVPVTNGGTLFIGQDQDSLGGGLDPAQAMQGDMDELMIWNRVLNSTEISQIENPKIRLDYHDVIFTDEDGLTLIPFFRVYDNRIDVKVPTIPANSTKNIYMYYGNSSATDQQSGINTYIYFDDFMTNTLANYTRSAGTAVVYTPGGYYAQQSDDSNSHFIQALNDILPDRYIFESQVYTELDTAGRNHIGVVVDWNNASNTGYRLVSLDSGYYQSKFASPAAETALGNMSNTSTYSDGHWMQYTIARIRSTGLLQQIVSDGFAQAASSVYTDTTYQTGHIGMFSWGQRSDYKELRVRDYPKGAFPTFSVGSEVLTNTLIKTRLSENDKWYWKPIKVWNGSAWVSKRVKVYNGSAWS